MYFQTRVKTVLNKCVQCKVSLNKLLLFIINLIKYNMELKNASKRRLVWIQKYSKDPVIQSLTLIKHGMLHCSYFGENLRRITVRKDER